MTRRPDDLPEEWHKCYDEPRIVRWPVWLFLALVGVSLLYWFLNWENV